MDGGGLHGRRPRPVADAPEVDASALAKAWLLTLVAEAPLQQVAEVPAADLARSGPALCGSILAALRSDAELEQLLAPAEDGGAPPAATTARLIGARTPAAVAAGVEALRAAAWRSLRAELRDPVPELIADLGDRLAFVCARVAEAALAERPAEAPRRTGPLAGALAASRGGEAPDAPEAVAAPPAAPTPAPFAPPPGVTPVAAGGAPPVGVEAVDLPDVPGGLDPLSSLAEELAAAPPAGVDGGPPAPTFATGPETVTVTRVRPVDTTWDELAQSGPPWLAAIERRLERRREDGLPFAVLVAEIDDLDRLIASQSGREVALALETAERNLTAELAPADMVVRERLGRWWLLSPDRDTTAARDLGERIAEAIALSVLSGAPLSVSMGLALCPDDGETTDELAGRADEGMFAARAAGIPLA